LLIDAVPEFIEGPTASSYQLFFTGIPARIGNGCFAKRNHIFSTGLEAMMETS